MKRVYDPYRGHNYQCVGETCITLAGYMGTGGGNVPIVLDDENLCREEVLPLGGRREEREPKG